MKYVVKLFAAAREEMGKGELEVELPDNASVSEFRAVCAAAMPGIEPLIRRARFAVNQQFVDDEHQVAPNDELALILPVSGG